MMNRKLFDYYKVTEAFIGLHKWDGDYLDNCIPWERDFYSGLIVQRLNKMQEAIDKQNQG